MLDPNQQDSQRRQSLALGLIFVIVMVYMTWASRQAPELPPGGADGGTAVAAAAPDAGIAAAVASPTPSVPSPAPTGAAEAELPPVKTVELERPDVRFRFTTEGAGLVFAELQGEKMREQERTGLLQGYKRIFGDKPPPRPQVNLAMPVPGKPPPLALTISGPVELSPTTRYRVEEQTDSRVVFTAQTANWQVRRTYEWPAERSWELRHTVELKNTSAQTAEGELALQYSRQVDPDLEEEPSMLKGTLGNQSQVVCGVGEDFKKLGPEQSPETFKGPVHFVGIDQQYFLSAIFPIGEALSGACALEPLAATRTATLTTPLSLAPGASRVLSLGLFLGPKDSEPLAAAHARLAPQSAYSPKLEKSEDYGAFEVLVRLLLGIMKFFYGLIHNWGVAIILLTVLVKLILFPLQYKSMVSMEQMKKLQPKLEAIKAKFKDDREKQQMETLKVYQEAKVNPLGGCFPLLIQMPVWIALFQSLRHSYDIYSEPFISPIWTDLTYKDPTYLLPLALGATMIITQRLQPPSMMDKNQMFVMTWVMPIFFTLIMLNYPAGLALYIFTNNLLSIAQTYGLRRYLAHREKVAAAGARG